MTLDEYLSTENWDDLYPKHILMDWQKDRNALLKKLEDTHSYVLQLEEDNAKVREELKGYKDRGTEDHIYF